MRIGFCKRFLSVSLDERLLVGNELVHYIIGDIGLRRLNAIAHPACAGVAGEYHISVYPCFLINEVELCENVSSAGLLRHY